MGAHTVCLESNWATMRRRLSALGGELHGQQMCTITLTCEASHGLSATCSSTVLPLAV